MYLVHTEEFDDFESASEFREQWKEAIWALEYGDSNIYYINDDNDRFFVDEETGEIGEKPLIPLDPYTWVSESFFDLSGEYREEDYEDCYEGLHDFHVVSYYNQNFYEHDPDLDDDDGEIPF